MSPPASQTKRSAWANSRACSPRSGRRLTPADLWALALPVERTLGARRQSPALPRVVADRDASTASDSPPHELTFHFGDCEQFSELRNVAVQSEAAQDI